MDEFPLCLTYIPLILASKHLILLDRKMRINLAGSHQREKSGAPGVANDFPESWAPRYREYKTEELEEGV